MDSESANGGSNPSESSKIISPFAKGIFLKRLIDLENIGLVVIMVKRHICNVESRDRYTSGPKPFGDVAQWESAKFAF